MPAPTALCANCSSEIGTLYNVSICATRAYYTNIPESAGNKVTACKWVAFYRFRYTNTMQYFAAHKTRTVVCRCVQARHPNTRPVYTNTPRIIPVVGVS